MNTKTRRYDLDWLRVLSMLTIFLFHCARFFNYEDWHVKNDRLSEGLTFFIDVLALWIMPLFFVISSASSNYSLDSRGGAEYLKERFKRLFIPLVFGSFVIIAPLQVWIERATHEPYYTGSFIHFYIHDYFRGFYLIDGNFAWMGIHLWYLEILFIFSLITLPLFLALKRGKLRGMITLPASLSRNPGGIYIFIIPLCLMELLVNLQPDGMGMRSAGGWSLLTYLVFFICGFLVSSDPRFKESMERKVLLSLLLAVCLTALFFAAGDYDIFSALGLDNYYVSTSIIRPACSWSWLVAFLGLGSRHLNFNNRFLKYANEAVLPFYILHQTVIVTIGLFLKEWDAGVTLKYIIISASSFASIMVIYDLLVKRFNVLRFLFGMRYK